MHATGTIGQATGGTVGLRRYKSAVFFWLFFKLTVGVAAYAERQT